MNNNRLDLYTSIVPNPRQKAIQDMGFNAFIHYGINTFTDKEWGDGKVDPSLFNPKAQDTDQWAEVLAAAGAKGVILTAKHHDGFCLWPTKTTAYSVASGPYKDGKGDVVREFSQSCKKYGLKFGFYLSPWDRNSELYGTDKYNDFYIEQLTELLTGYGDIFCVWLDGACGAHMDGKSKQVYDFDRIYETVYKYQPDCAISNCGPDVRWVGNEAGYARESEWNVVPKMSFSTQNIEEKSQQEDNVKFRTQAHDVVYSDLGSRAFLSKYDEFIWYPAEVDVSIRPGWFYHKNEDKKVRSLNNLLNIYYGSVGGNSLLLLNVPPDTCGRINAADENRLRELGAELNKAFGSPVEAEVTSDEKTVKLDFKKTEFIDKVQLKEDCDFSQRVESFAIYALKDGTASSKPISRGTVIGFNKIVIFKNAVQADGLLIVIDRCRKEPHIKLAKAYGAGGMIPKKPLFKKIVLWFNRLGHKIYMWFENISNGSDK